jgi:predicted nucleic-acid-binding protein
LIAVDTNILARFYVDDETDSEAQRQRPLSAKLIRSGKPLFVPLAVALELAWLLRAHYQFNDEQVAEVLDHLGGMDHVTVERWDALQQAIEWMRSGLGFADALHLACSEHCGSFATLDDRGFARKAVKLKLLPPVMVLT